MSREIILFKNTAIYLLSNFVSKAFTIILLPLYTFYLTTEEYGYYDLIISSISIIVPIITLQVYDSTYRYLLDAKSESEKKKIISSAFCVSVAVVVLFMFIYYFFVGFIELRYKYQILVLILSFVFSNFFQLTARGLKKNVVYAVANLLFVIITLLFSSLFIIVFNLKLDALLYSSILSNFFVILYINFKLAMHRLIDLNSFSRELLIKMIKYSIPLIPNTINWWIVNTFNRYIINFYLGMDANGIFAVAYKFPSIITIASSIFYLAWQESAILEYESEERNNFYSRVFNTYMVMQFSALLILLPITKWAIKYFVGSSFNSSWLYVPFLYIGAIFLSFASFYGVGYLSSKNTKGAFTTSIVSGVLNIICNIILMPVIGLYAASISVMLSYLAMWLLRLYETKKYFIISINTLKLILLTSILCLYIVLYYFDNFILNIFLSILSIVIVIIFNKNILYKTFNFLTKKIKYTHFFTN